MATTAEPALAETMDQRLSLAASLARRGRHLAALELLDSVDAEDPSRAASTNDLRARMFAQLGRFADAERIWRRLSEADPANESYRSALAAIASERLRPRPWQAATVTALVLVAMLPAVVGYLLFTRMQSDMRVLGERLVQVQTTMARSEEREAQRDASQEERVAARMRELTQPLDAEVSSLARESATRAAESARTLETFSSRLSALEASMDTNRTATTRVGTLLRETERRLRAESDAGWRNLGERLELQDRRLDELGLVVSRPPAATAGDGNRR